MLLSRSPLSFHPKMKLPHDLHVSDAPPAFILSQDQTLLEFLGLPHTHGYTGSRSLFFILPIPQLSRFTPQRVRKFFRFIADYYFIILQEGLSSSFDLPPYKYYTLNNS